MACYRNQPSLVANEDSLTAANEVCLFWHQIQTQNLSVRKTILLIPQLLVPQATDLRCVIFFLNYPALF